MALRSIWRGFFSSAPKVDRDRSTAITRVQYDGSGSWVDLSFGQLGETYRLYETDAYKACVSLGERRLD